MERRFGILHDQQPLGAEGNRAVAYLGADRAAAAGYNNRSALEETLQPAIVDLDGRAQQQILDVDRRKPRRLATVAERRQPAHGQAEPARLHQRRFRLGVGLEGRRRKDHAGNRDAALRAIVHNAVDRIEPAEHRNAADALSLIGVGRREDADRPGSGDGAAFDGSQQHFGVGRPPEDERRIRFRRARLLSGPRVAEITIGNARSAQEDDLEYPVKRDGDFAEEEFPEHVRRDQHVIEHQQRDREHGRRAHDVHQVGERGETPLRFVEMKKEIDEAGINDERRQKRE